MLKNKNKATIAENNFIYCYGTNFNQGNQYVLNWNGTTINLDYGVYQNNYERIITHYHNDHIPPECISQKKLKLDVKTNPNHKWIKYSNHLPHDPINDNEEKKPFGVIIHDWLLYITDTSDMEQINFKKSDYKNIKVAILEFNYDERIPFLAPTSYNHHSIQQTIKFVKKHLKPETSILCVHRSFNFFNYNSYLLLNEMLSDYYLYYPDCGDLYYIEDDFKLSEIKVAPDITSVANINVSPPNHLYEDDKQNEREVLEKLDTYFNIKKWYQELKKELVSLETNTVIECGHYDIRVKLLFKYGQSNPNIAEMIKYIPREKIRECLFVKEPIINREITIINKKDKKDE